MDNQNPQSGKSLLDEIIAQNQEAVRTQMQAQEGQNGGQMPMGTPPTPPPQNQKTRDPMSTSQVLKLIGTIFLVLVIFLGIFLSYIVFNPDQAAFFNTVFNINPDDIASLLRNLINISFGITSIVFSLIFLVTLFQAIWTPKEQKRKKATQGIFAVISGFLLFTIIGTWAVLFTKIQQTNFSNLGGDILIYDNEIFVHPEYQKDARLYKLRNIIGPITLRYKIDENAKRTAQQTGGKIVSYSINFDGAKCQSGSSKVTGSNPTTEEAIICTFDQIKDYKPQGEYVVSTFNGDITVPIKFTNVEVKGLLKITEQENKDGELRKFFDAQSLKQLGEPRWYYLHSNGTNEEKKTDIFSLPLTNKATIIALKAFDKNNLFGEYDRIFIVKTNDSQVTGKITTTPNTANPQEYTFSLSDLTVNKEEILSIDWRINDQINACNQSKTESCTHIFNAEGRYKIDAIINLIGNKKVTITDTIQIDQPLIIERHAKVTTKNGKILNTEETFDFKTKRFTIKDIVPPEKIFLDARDVISNNPGYILKSVKWNINDGKQNETKEGEKIEFDIQRTARYSIVAEYGFEKSIKTGQADDNKVAYDHILLDLERKNLTPILKITKDSDYVPVRVTVDASQSHSEYSEIVKFIYDFGEGRPPAEGDAIQTYQYTTPGEKTVTVTIVDINGQTASTKQTVVLKDTPKNLNFIPSLSPAQVNHTVDFRADGTTGQIEDYLWNFGDNTPISHGYEVSHTFSKAGTYTITLTVRYVDGTEKSTNQKFVVVDALE